MEVLKRHHVWKQGPAIAAVQRHSSDVQNLPLFFDTDLGWTIPLVDTEMGIRRLFGFVSTEWVVRAREEPAINRPKDNDSFFASRAALLSDGFSVGVGDRHYFVCLQLSEKAGALPLYGEHHNTTSCPSQCDVKKSPFLT